MQKEHSYYWPLVNTSFPKFLYGFIFETFLTINYNIVLWAHAVVGCCTQVNIVPLGARCSRLLHPGKYRIQSILEKMTFETFGPTFFLIFGPTFVVMGPGPLSPGPIGPIGPMFTFVVILMPTIVVILMPTFIHSYINAQIVLHIRPHSLLHIQFGPTFFFILMPTFVVILRETRQQHPA